MKVLVACEYSGRVRDALLALGHDAWSCDFEPPYSLPERHYQEDCLDLLDEGWDMVIAHPPCTYLCSSGLHWNKRVPGRAEKTEEALRFIEALWEAPVERLAIENPQGCINTRLPHMPRPQFIQPYQFGDDASKKTGLWKRNLPDLLPTAYVEPRWVQGKNGKMLPRWSNQTDSGQNALGPSANRWKVRSETYKGIAEAMAEQWGGLCSH